MEVIEDIKILISLQNAFFETQKCDISYFNINFIKR